MSLRRMKRSGSIDGNLSDLKKLPEPDNDICENLLFNIIKKQKKQITIKIYKHLFFNSLVPPICREKYKNDENFYKLFERTVRKYSITPPLKEETTLTTIPEERRRNGCTIVF